MSNILRGIRNQSAYDLLRKYNIKMGPPVKIDALLDAIGISTVAMDFTDLEQDSHIPQGSILGAAISKENQLAIFYRTGDSRHRRKFTLAHELGHCCLHCPTDESSHIEYRIDPFKIHSLTKADIEKERAANVFAGQLLIPKATLMEMYGRMPIPSLSALSEIFDVSTTVMAARLDYLNLSYYKDSSTYEDNPAFILL